MKTILFSLLLMNCSLGYAQFVDTLVVSAIREEKLEDSQYVYAISMTNMSHTPICILHSIHIFLIDPAPQRLAVREKSGMTEIYSMDYAAPDTLIDYEGPIDNFDGEIILPLQELRFRLLLPSTDKEKKLKFEYIRVKNFCYPDFEKEISKNIAGWYKKYKRIPRSILL